MKIIPIRTEHNKHFFCDDMATWEVQRGYDRLVTNFLKINTEMNLFSLGETKSLLDTGLMDSTDAIDSNVRLDAVVLKITKGDAVNFFVHETTYTPLAQLSVAAQGNYRRLELNYAGLVSFYSDNRRSLDQIRYKVAGSLNLEIGDLTVCAGSVDFPERFADKVEIVGFAIDAARVNLNRLTA